MWLIAAVVVFAAGAMWIDSNLAHTSMLEASKAGVAMMGGGAMVNIATRNRSSTSINPSTGPART
ncbi:hypothetical protein [Actinomycetospora callitridis]|uniref:hypothetical protein n=1 Tax=Actinomycetospora callitridis TaxID=913944 RepID=UPI002365F855|nr:hypothetical protein [Actinomycetospora callitridis]MDD7921250.1 hypothetical protein [Actinomycetospora callitridis]